MGGAASAQPTEAKTASRRNECTASTLAPMPNHRLSQTPHQPPVSLNASHTPSDSPMRQLPSQSPAIRSTLPTPPRPAIPPELTAASMGRGLSAVASMDRDMLQYTTMSLGMDPEDLLFNMMYFGDTQSHSPGNMGNMLNAVIEETIAAHSENNTPYKLKPVPTSILAHVRSETLYDLDEIEERDCAVCKEEFEMGSKVILLNKCNHRFHGECLRHWMHMVSSHHFIPWSH